MLGQNIKQAMKTIFIRVNSTEKAAVLKDLALVTEVKVQADAQAKEEYDAMKQMVVTRKNKAFAKHLEF